MECYYHNVAKYEDSSPFPIDVLNLFYKKMWFEYTGIVKIGIDASKVKISSPDSSGVVTIAIPQAEILGNPDIDTNSMSDPIVDTFPPIIINISAEEKTKALNDAQDKMKKAAEGNENLKFQARERAKALLEQYVKNVGNELGKSYTVQWADAE